MTLDAASTASASAPSAESRAAPAQRFYRLLTTAALTAAFMGPALSIYALFGPLTLLAGTGVGFVMFVGLIVTLLLAISFGMRPRNPSAGGVYTWTRTVWAARGPVPRPDDRDVYTICLIFPPISSDNSS